MEHLQEQIKSLEAAGGHISDVPWMFENEARRNRWSKYFTGRHDLAEDDTLKRFKPKKEDLDLIRRQTECLLDNVLAEANAAAKSLLNEATTTGNVATFTTWALPLIRKIWPRLFARNMVSVQPMKGPTGKAFTVDFQYDSVGGAYAGGTSIYANPDYNYSNDPGEGVEPKRLKMNISGVTLTAIAKKLAADWNQEASQDMASQHGLDLQSEVLTMMGMEIEREINTELILDVYGNATTNTTWTSTQPASPSPWANATPKQFAESLFDAIEDANKQIFDRVYVNANFILAGSTFANRLRKVNSFRMLDSAEPSDARISASPNVFGVLSEKYVVYIDPFFSKDQAIVGHKSDNWMYTGYVYAPYIPLWQTPVVWNTKMQPGQGIMSRYAKYAKNGDFFATVTVV